MMVEALKSSGYSEDGDIKRIIINPKDANRYLNKGLEYFINKNSLKLFERFDISSKFLDEEPSLWETNQEYLDARGTLNSLKVVNDVAERGVKLVQEYLGFGTKDEKQLQYLLQIVKNYNEQYPNCNKSTLMN